MASIAINKGSLDLALQTLLKNNFDVDSSACIVTLMKILDNLLQKPGNEKVRSIRLQNPAFANKVGKHKGGVDFLLACGFTFQEEPQQLLQPLHSAAEPQFLKLETSNEDTNHLVAARHMLLMCATHELKMKAEELPKFVPPPAPITMTSTALASSSAAPSSSFNPYQGQRYDGLSAAVGARLGPDGKYISPTEQKLAKLQQKQAKLQETMHIPLEDRGLIATLPGNTASSLTPTDSSGPQTGEGKSDSSLLAAYAKKQMEQSKQQANAGFTTKAMRDLAKLEKSKVYSHVILSIQFPDGTSLRGKFLPLETVARVQQVVLECCRDDEIASEGQKRDESAAESLLELYVTPPRRKLIPTKTLSDEGLVPASKVYVSWKKQGTPKVGLSPGHFLLPELFAPTASRDMQPASGGAEFPTSKPVADSIEAEANLPAAANKVPKKKKAKNKEDDLLKRMMGRGL